MRKKSGRKRKSSTLRVHSRDEDEKTRDDTVDAGETCELGGKSTIQRASKSNAVMRRFSQQLLQKKIIGLKAEFADLATSVDYSKEPHVAFDQNLSKNRYTNVYCYDRTRVKLSYQPNKEGDYIHANYVDSKLVQLPNKYICTQGPMESTVNDFWRMVWQTKPEHIVMLCKNVEAGRPKCMEYYSTKIGDIRTYGTITVRTTRVVTKRKEKYFESIRITYSSKLDEKDIRQLNVHRWLDWPDFGVPSSGLAMFRVIRILREDCGSTAIIHCSAGVGRTGTLLAAAICYEILFTGKDLKVTEVVKEMRAQRASMIQTESQYIFLHRALGEYVQNKLHESTLLKEFFVKYKDYIKQMNKSSPERAAVQPTASPAKTTSIFTPTIITLAGAQTAMPAATIADTKAKTEDGSPQRTGGVGHLYNMS